jgi:sulfoxide reductase catalytic subunit YedY
MLIRRAPDLTDNDVTSHGLYLRRREFIGGAAGLGLLGSAGTASARGLTYGPGISATEKPAPNKDSTTYNKI